MGVIIDARDNLVTQLYSLEPGSDEMLRQAQAIKIMSEIDINDRKLEFELDKEETRKLEKSNEYEYSDYDRQLRWVELGIRFIDVVFNPGRNIKAFMDNRVRMRRDIMGYQFEETGVIGSHTFNNAQKDKYD